MIDNLRVQDFDMKSGVGIIKIISTSKIIKIKEIRKNCNEKGTRALLEGLKPHSKGEFFSILM